MFKEEKYLLARTNFPKVIVEALAKYGIISLVQLSEKLQKNPRQLEKVAGCTEKQLNYYINQEPIKVPVVSNMGYQNFAQPPLNGYIENATQSNVLKSRRLKLSKERMHLSKAI